MDNPTMPLRKEEYEEPDCLLCASSNHKIPQATIPQQRISQRLDDYMGRRDYPGAERHLKYWMEEAKMLRDDRGEFMILNEMMGFYRKTGRRTEAVEAAQKALALIPQLEAEGTISAGTCYVNIGTVYNTFHEDETALPYFEKAKAIYEARLSEDDGRLGGLYNNMALVYSGLRRYEEANDFYARALDVMKEVSGGEIGQAITYLNLAENAEAQIGMEDAETVIDEYLEEAERLLKTPELPQDAYLAFVYGAAISTFEYYGWFQTAQELKERQSRCQIGGKA